MNKNNGISAFKISQTQHKRMKMALWGIGILLAFQSIMDPLFHSSPYNVVVMLLMPILKSKFFLLLLNGAIVACSGYILNVLRVALKPFSKWAPWFCLAFIFMLALSCILNIMNTWYIMSSNFNEFTMVSTLQMMLMCTYWMLQGMWFVLVCILIFNFSGRIRENGWVLFALLLIENVCYPLFISVIVNLVSMSWLYISLLTLSLYLLLYYFIYRCFEVPNDEAIA